MSIPGSRAAIDINLDEFERRLRIASTTQGQVDDPLSELARLVDEARPAPVSQAQQSKPREEDLEHCRPAELRSSFDEPDSVLQQASAEPEPEPVAGFGEYPPAQPASSQFEGPPHSKIRFLFAPALAVAGVAMFASVFALRYGMPGLPQKPPFIAALSGPTKVKPPSELPTTTTNDSGILSLSDNAKRTPVKIVNSEEQPVDLGAEASVGAIAKPQVNAAPQASDSALVKATIDTPVVMPSAAVPPATASQFPDPKPVRTIMLRPDGAPILAAAASPAMDAPPSSVVAETAKAGLKAQPQNRPDATGSPQSSTPRIELPTKQSVKSSARVVVAKTDTTAPDGKVLPEQGSIPKAEKAKHAKTHEAVAEKPAAATEQAVGPGPDSATKSDGWAVQLAAPRSESEAQSSAQRLNAKYATALNGATIGIQKAVVKGATLYRLRVAGLSKADAAALCARLKGEGGDCFIAK